jgi:hypothetical protein
LPVKIIPNQGGNQDKSGEDISSGEAEFVRQRGEEGRQAASELTKLK